MRRIPVVFKCDGAALAGMLHAEDDKATRGVVVVVGGPQYRVGSHRHFYLLAEALSSARIPVLRFDYRGMGDSDGEFRGFEHVDNDIRAAIDELCARLPSINDVVLVGLCDAASAIMMYACQDERVAGVTLMNPWVRSEESIARVTVKRYYLRRLASRDMWGKVFGGSFKWRESLTSLLALVRKAIRRPQSGQAAARTQPFQARMLNGMRHYDGRVLLITSGDDLTAAEFLQLVAGSADWRQIVAREQVSKRSLAAANHTFSSEQWRSQVNDWIRDWLNSW